MSMVKNTPRSHSTWSIQDPLKFKIGMGQATSGSSSKMTSTGIKKVVKLQKINYTVVSDTTTGLDLYQQKKLDLTPLANQQVKNYKTDKAFREYPYSYVSFLKYNQKDANAQRRAAFNNKHIRLALSLSIDRQALTKKVLGDGSQTPTGFVATDLARDPKTGEDFAKEQVVKNTVNYNPNWQNSTGQRD